jgi:toxin ParE1/3/4
LRELQRAAETVAEDPRRGLACDNIRSGYRKFPAGLHVVFFRASESRIVIVRILHRRMDFERHLP